MKIYGSVKVVVAGVTSQPKKDGSGFYYNISVIDSETNEAGMLSCDESVFQTVSVKEFKRFNEYTLVTVYDSNYKWLRVVGIQ